MELNIKNTFQLLKDFVIPSSAVFLSTIGLFLSNHWSAILISRNHSITRLIHFPKKLKKNNPIQRSLLY